MLESKQKKYHHLRHTHIYIVVDELLRVFPISSVRLLSHAHRDCPTGVEPTHILIWTTICGWLCARHTQWLCCRNQLRPHLPHCKNANYTLEPPNEIIHFTKSKQNKNLTTGISVVVSNYEPVHHHLPVVMTNRAKPIVALCLDAKNKIRTLYSAEYPTRNWSVRLG